MNRTGLLIALALAAAVGLLFGLFPKLDLDLAGLFFDPSADGFWGRLDPVLGRLRELSRGIVTVLLAPAVLALIGKLVMPRRAMLIPGRAALLMIITLALGPGLVTNSILKNHWGRPRPIDVTVFGGEEHFVAWWDPRGDCPENCSFVAGEPAGAFWTLAPAALVPPAWRAAATAAALVFGAGIGVVRMAGGGHFFTDIVFAGFFTFLIIWLMHGCLYRWPATAISDRAVERLLEWPLSSVQGAVRRRRRRPPAAGGGPNAAGEGG